MASPTDSFAKPTSEHTKEVPHHGRTKGALRRLETVMVWPLLVKSQSDERAFRTNVDRLMTFCQLIHSATVCPRAL